MRRVAIGIGAALGVLAALAAILGYQRVSTLEVVAVQGDVHVLFGLGGNVGILRTERGAVVVDTMTFRMQGERIRLLAERLGGGPVQAVLNTHYHRDHTHGNPAFPAGLRIVATARTLDHLRTRDAGFWRGPTAERLPSETFVAEHELRIGGKTIRALHPGRGHTDGDLVVLFVEDRVVHLGDLLFQGRYPTVDLEAGGSFPAWIESLDRVLELEFDRAIPGHGPLTDREGLRAFQDFLREVWQVAEDAARAGLSLEETLARARLTRDAGYERIWVPFVVRMDRDLVLRRAWQEASGAAAGPQG